MSSRKNLVVDLIALAGFLVIMEPRLTGIALHEWISVALAAVAVFHVLVHWNWLAGVIRRLRAASRLSKSKLVINALIFTGFTVAMLSGFMVSESIIELFGLRRSANFSWREVHDISANLTLLLTGVHVALNWGWLKKTVRDVMARPLGRPRAVPGGTLVVSVQSSNEIER